MRKINEKIFKNFFNSLNQGGQLKSIFHRISLFLFLAVFGSCLFFVNAFAAGNDMNKEDILTALEKKYGGKSFETDFNQTSTLAALEITESASGKAFFSHPGKMRWEYIEPEHHEIITNGKLLWIFRPQENQVMQGDASQFFKAGAGGAFLSDISLIRKNYIITLKAVTADHVEIDLVPKQKNTDLSLIEIQISKKDNEIKKVVTHNSYDDTTLFEFKNIRFLKINPGVFEFQPSEGINIIELN
jgi:outer membrane lipoprotein carrier protein